MDPTGRAEHGGLMELADLYRRTVETWTARVEAVPAGAWEAPTPCTEWTVRDLVNHVVGEDAWTVPLMRGSTMAEVGDTLDGDEDAGEYVRQLAADHLVHAWDLAAATGGDTHLDEDLVADVATWFAEREDTYRSVGAVGPRVDAGGSPQADLLAAAGRDVAWTPPPR
jgi:hypothetical protein